MTAERLVQLDDVTYESPRRMRVEDYLRLSASLPGRYEYWDGLMYPQGWPPGSHSAMAGNSQTHSRLTVRLLAALEGHLSDGPCHAYNGDMRIYLDATRYVFPDAYVVCGEKIASNMYDLHDALMICEIRSQSTDGFDRGDKFEGYQGLPSLREYVLLDNRKIQATVLRRGEDGVWRYLIVFEGADLELETIGLRISLTHLYRGLALDSDTR
ncbi:MAG TPA: Uma2 family endonuclease [Chloroflexota bacterium]|nr:Uma2 family endonuclease [Chloroflexota bacterium]